jgi:putative ABC transport system ATP-binding protein
MIRTESGKNRFILIAKEVTKSYAIDGSALTQVLKPVSLSVEKAEFLAISGTSGSGKTTLLNLLGGLDTPTSGRISVDGSHFEKMTDEGRARFRCKKIGFIFQTFNLIPTLSALENVEYPLVLLGYPKKERWELSREALEKVGLSQQSTKRPQQMSGGQRQRVAIARAMVKGPKIVLADEPTANLDTQTAEGVLDLMQSLNQKEGVTFVFSTHDSKIIQRASRVFSLNEVSSPDKAALSSFEAIRVAA